MNNPVINWKQTAICIYQLQIQPQTDISERYELYFHEKMQQIHILKIIKSTYQQHEKEITQSEIQAFLNHPYTDTTTNKREVFENILNLIQEINGKKESDIEEMEQH